MMRYCSLLLIKKNMAHQLMFNIIAVPLYYMHTKQQWFEIRMSRSKSSGIWLKAYFGDPYVKQAKIDGYRSRASYKLL